MGQLRSAGTGRRKRGAVGKLCYTASRQTFHSHGGAAPRPTICKTEGVNKMAATFDKDMNIITNFLKDMDIIAALDDQPNDVGGLTAAELTAKFDEGGTAIQESINGTLIPEVLGLDGTEASRQQAENDRAEGEKQRREAEAARVAAETARAQAEQVRVQNENSRTAAEAARVQAEQQRADETAGIVARATEQAGLAASRAAEAVSSVTAANAASASAAEQASAASGSAAAAAASAGTAAQDAQSAATAQRLAESWAVGGTGQRQGEDSNNARYWSQVAQSAAGGGVTSFHGRSGVVEPAAGDYTAAMVGAIPAAEKGAAGGVATLGEDGLVTLAQLPDRFSVRTCRMVVGTSAAGWTERECDYLCDGTDDEVEIQAAIDAMPDGGTVLLLEGTYVLSHAWLTVTNAHVTICGAGPATILSAEYKNMAPLIRMEGDYGTLSQMKIVGGDFSVLAQREGLLIRGMHCTVDSVVFSEVSSSVYVDTAADWATVRFCTLGGPATSLAQYTMFLYNVFERNRKEEGVAISMQANCYKFIGNFVDGHPIYAGGSYAVLTDNYVSGPADQPAINLAGAQLICRGNVCSFLNESSTYTGKTIDVQGSNCIVTSNITMLKEVSTGSGTGNIIADNIVIV